MPPRSQPHPPLAETPCVPLFQTQSFSFSMLAAEAFLPGSPLWQESHTPSKHAQATEQQNLKLAEVMLWDQGGGWPGCVAGCCGPPLRPGLQ